MAAPGAKKALVPTSSVISAPPRRVRATMEANRGSGTISLSVWAPMTMAETSSTDTPASIARNARKRVESKAPDSPMRRCRGSPEALAVRYVMASSGLVTTTKNASGEYRITCSTTPRTMPVLVSSNCSRVMPGLRAIPAMMTTTSEPAVSAYPLLPTTRTSHPATGKAWVRSSALPMGIFSITSTRTRSASSCEASQCAVVWPTIPAPTIVTFGRPRISRLAPVAALRHIVDYGRRKLAGLHFPCAVHQARQIVGDNLLPKGLLHGFGDPPGRFVPPEVLEHHHPG